MKTNSRISAQRSRRTLSGLTMAAAVGLALPAPTVWALGLRIPNQDPEAIARGNAFVATADNPSALYYNPAGITQMQGHNIQVGALNYFGLTTTYESPGGRSVDTDYEIVPVPQIYYAWTPDRSRFSFGLGVYSPFGLGLEWPEDTPFRTLAIEGRARYITLNPVVAWRPCDQLSLGIGPTFNYSDLMLRTGILSPVPGGDEFKFEGDDIGFGFNAGVLWQPHPKWSFGAQYRAATSIDYEGTARITSALVPAGKVDSSAGLDFPQIATVGVSFRPTPRWNVEANMDWTDWNTFDTLQITQTTLGPYPMAMNWRGSWFYEFGVSHHFPSGYYLGCGYFYSSNSTSERDFGPAVPDTDMHVGSVGGGYRGKTWSWGLAAQLITGPERDINTPKTSAGGQSPNGSYQWFVPALTFSVGYRF